MDYDLIVAGAGPGGLMAARTAAADGFKVLLLERKKNISDIKRDCAQIFYIRKISFDRITRKQIPYHDGYTEPVSAEVTFDGARLHFLALGITLDYRGPLRAYYNKISLSPGGYQIYRFPPFQRIWGFYYQKEALVAGMLADAERAGVEVVNEAFVTGARNTDRGVEVRVRKGWGEAVFTARHAIAADGRTSRVADSLGLNENRPGRRIRHRLSYILEGVRAPLKDTTYFNCTIPSISPTGNIGIGISADGLTRVGVGSSNEILPATILDKFLKLPAYREWFGDTRIVSKMADGNQWHPPIKNLVVGNILLVGDAGAPIEAFMQGAVACGYQAVKAIEKESRGENGYAEYSDWWRNSFAFNKKNITRTLAERNWPLNRLHDDAELDYIWSLCQGEIGIMEVLIEGKLDIVKRERPHLYDRIMAPAPTG